MNPHIPMQSDGITTLQGYEHAKAFFHLMKEKHGHFDTGSEARKGNLNHWQNALTDYFTESFGKEAVASAKSQNRWFMDVVSIGGLFNSL